MTKREKAIQQMIQNITGSKWEGWEIEDFVEYIDQVYRIDLMALEEKTLAELEGDIHIFDDMYQYVYWYYDEPDMNVNKVLMDVMSYDTKAEWLESVVNHKPLWSNGKYVVILG